MGANRGLGLRLRTPASTTFLLAWLACVCLVSVPAWSRADVAMFDIPAQPLPAALNLFAQQADMEILYKFEEIGGLSGSAVHGKLDKHVALLELLGNTGLHAIFSSATSATIRLTPISTLAPSTAQPAVIDDRSGAARANTEAVQSPAAEQLEEITVTARRKEEVLTEVPASITAYSADFLQKQNIQNFTDYATRIPNMTFQYGQGSSYSSTGFSGGRVTTIRGVAGENTTAYYVDDTPVPSTISPQVLDLERLEVLKGPQGTLFGASSMGGNLRFITHVPSLATDSYTVQLQGGGTSGGGPDVDAQALANVALVPERLGLDAAVGYTRDSGFITRRFPDSSGALVSKGGQGADQTVSATLKLRLRVTDRLEATLAAMGQTSHLEGYPAAYVPLPAYRPVSYILDRSHDVPEYSQDRWGLASLVLRYAGTRFNIVSSTSYFQRHVHEQEDDSEGTNYFFENSLGTDLGNPAFYYINDVGEVRMTHETRLSFEEGAVLPRLSGTVGIFYQYQYQTFDNPVIPVPQLTAAGLAPDYLVDLRVPSYENDSAVFSELYYKILPKLTLTLGAREYRVQQKTDSYVISGVFNSPGGDARPAVSHSQSGLVPKAVLSYEIGDAGNVYASAAEGFRPGGTQVLPDFCNQDLANLGYTPAQASGYKSDTLWSYEIGAKSRLAQGRMSASAALFQLNWSQIQQTVLLPTCTFTFVANAGKARIRGGELEVSGRPLEGVPLAIQAGLGYTDGVLLDPGLISQPAGSSLTQVPTLTGTLSLSYERPLSASLSWFAAADYAYTGSVKVNEGSSGIVTRQPFNMVGANVGLQFGRSQLMLYGKNLLNEHLNLGDLYSIGFEREQALPGGGTQLLPLGAVSRPLQFGLQYRTTF